MPADHSPLTLPGSSSTRYYSILNLGEDATDAIPSLYHSRRHTAYLRPLTALLGIVGAVAVVIGCLGLTVPSVASRLHRWTTAEVEVSQGSNMLQGVFEWGEFSKRWHAQSQFKAFPGLWRAGLSQETGQPVTQHGELQIKEGMASLRMQMTKTAGSLVSMATKTSFETSNEYSFGGALGPRFQPRVFAANIGTREGDTQVSGGLVTDGNIVRLQGAVEGKHGDSKYKLSLQSGSRHRPVIWKASVTSDRPIDLQKPYRAPVGVGIPAPQRPSTVARGKKFKTYTYMGEEENFPPEY
eukprot:EG_transcript_18462